MGLCSGKAEQCGTAVKRPMAFFLVIAVRVKDAKKFF